MDNTIKSQKDKAFDRGAFSKSGDKNPYNCSAIFYKEWEDGKRWAQKPNSKRFMDKFWNNKEYLVNY
jgi:hypothetical protein